MSAYSFSLAGKSDKARIVAFLDANWGEKHPLVHLDDFFCYYYENGERLQFALCEENGAIVALAGYILANKSETPDIWVSIWCAAKGQNGAGLELMSALPDMTHARVMACNNIREKTTVFYTFLGYTAARLSHFYRLAAQDTYAVAHIADKTILPVPKGDALRRIESAAQLQQDYLPDSTLCPYKDLWYLSRRYFAYPRQSYAVWARYESGRAAQLLVTRTVNVNGTNVLRIVDYIGNPADFYSLGFGINSLMQAEHAEYADCYCHGISAQCMAKAGFCERARDSANILPNYLSPVLYENTEYFFFTTHDTAFTMFKADGDQDRPNILL